MAHQRIYAETLHHAADAAGGADALARRLNVPRHRLQRWMAGYGSPPLEVFLASLDIVAAGAALLGVTRSVRLPSAADAMRGRLPGAGAAQDNGKSVNGRF